MHIVSLVDMVIYWLEYPFRYLCVKCRKIRVYMYVSYNSRRFPISLTFSSLSHKSPSHLLVSAIVTIKHIQQTIRQKKATTKHATTNAIENIANSINLKIDASFVTKLLHFGCVELLDAEYETHKPVS